MGMDISKALEMLTSTEPDTVRVGAMYILTDETAQDHEREDALKALDRLFA